MPEAHSSPPPKSEALLTNSNRSYFLLSIHHLFYFRFYPHFPAFAPLLFDCHSLLSPFNYRYLIIFLSLSSFAYSFSPFYHLYQPFSLCYAYNPLPLFFNNHFITNLNPFIYFHSFLPFYHFHLITLTSLLLFPESLYTFEILLLYSSSPFLFFSLPSF